MQSLCCAVAANYRVSDNVWGTIEGSIAEYVTLCQRVYACMSRCAVFHNLLSIVRIPAIPCISRCVVNRISGQCHRMPTCYLPTSGTYVCLYMIANSSAGLARPHCTRACTQVILHVCGSVCARMHMCVCLLHAYTVCE